MKRVGFLLSVIVFLPVCVLGQTWTQTSAPTKNWSSIACSADGQRLIAAVSGGGIYSSTNFGATWDTNNVPNLAWNSVVSSADGSKLVAVFLGGVFTSTNSGATWISNSVLSSYSAAITADGSTVATTGAQGISVFISTNAGGVWFSNRFPANVVSGRYVALSANGAKLAAGNDYGTILTSTNLGATWTTNQWAYGSCKSIAVSADGSKLAAAFGSDVFISTNGGISWRTNNFAIDFIIFLAASADGSKMFAGHGRLFFASTNTGATWSSGIMSNAFECVTMSADGNLLAAAASYSGIWVSQTTPSPQLNISSSGAGAKISWTVPSTNFVLQQSSDLQNWSAATNPATLNFGNLQDEVVLPNNDGNVFYRLGTP